MQDLVAGGGEAALTRGVRRAVGDESAEVIDWRCSPLSYVNALSEYRGLFRFSGTARAAGEARAWSVVLKLVRRPPDAPTEPAHAAYYWKREALAYGSGLLDGLPGVKAPRCFGVDDDDGETAWLWLEDVRDMYGGTWPLERYRLAARHLGNFGGAFLAGRPLPDYGWLLTRYPGSGAPAARDAVSQPATWEHPLLRRAFPVPIAERFLRQVEDRRAFRAALNQAPRTLCHYDFGSQNLFARRAADGTDETVAIDWELMALGPVGADAASLVIATLRRFDIGMDEAGALEEAVVDGYAEGLREAGWQGEAIDVRRAYLSAVALRLGLVPSILNISLETSQREIVERVWGRPLEEIVERWAALAYFVLDRADAARELLEDA